jgi:hypothetical protein
MHKPEHKKHKDQRSFALCLLVPLVANLSSSLSISPV